MAIQLSTSLVGSILRKVGEIPGFFSFVRTDKEHLLPLYYKLQCVPLLPVDEIIPAFHALKTLMLSDKNYSSKLNAKQKREDQQKMAALTKFLNYFERQWLQRVS